MAQKYTHSEEELVILLTQHRREAMGILYDRYASALYGVVYNIVRSEALAEDILQETFIKIWKNIHSYNKDKGRLFTWMLNIARNLAIDKLRSKTYRAAQQQQNLEGNTEAIETQKPVQMFPEHIGLSDLVHLLRPEQRELVDIVFFQGYSHTEASEELGIPLGTVKTRLRTALTTLRKAFGQNSTTMLTA